MDNWDEVRTAFHVARAGTVSAAASTLGVHHATVIRHVDALEAQLGVKLFQRHAKGYTPTEAGEDLLRVAAATDDQLNQLHARLKGQGEGVSGELTVTSVPEVSRRIAPVLAEFAEQHPDLQIRYLTSQRLFRLQYGEAHVALRGGAKPQDPDNVVQRLCEMQFVPFASPEYLKRHPAPKRIEDLADHALIAATGLQERAPHNQWMKAQMPNAIRSVAQDHNTMMDMVQAGLGIGFLVPWLVPDELVQCFAPRPEWSAPIWLVTHVDQHRTQKVKLFTELLKSHAAKWAD